MTATFTDLVDTYEPHWRVVGRQWRELLPEGSYAWPIADFRHKDHPTLGHVVYTWHGGALTATLHLIDGVEQTESNWAVLQAAMTQRRHWGGDEYLIALMSKFIEDPDRWVADTGLLSAPGRVSAGGETAVIGQQHQAGRAWTESWVRFDWLRTYTSFHTLTRALEDPRFRPGAVADFGGGRFALTPAQLPSTTDALRRVFSLARPVPKFELSKEAPKQKQPKKQETAA